MEYYSLPTYRRAAPPQQSVLTIGCFDGVHRGHLAVLAQAAACAREYGVPLVALTFPLDDSPKLPQYLATEQERAALLAAAGAEGLAVLPFSRTRFLSATEFIDGLLLSALGCLAAVVGEGFRFGAGAAGDAATLGARLPRGAFVVPPCLDGGVPISTTRVRGLLLAGDAEGARRLLGRPYSLSGTVAHGAGLGHTLGFPTANITPPAGQVLPAEGVYVTEVTLADGSRHRAVSDIGTRPTVGGEGVRVESHLLGVAPTLYGEEITVHLLARLRGERRFPDTRALARQLKKDCEAAKKWNKDTCN